jgi:chlorobactene glucosyltransferase
MLILLTINLLILVLVIWNALAWPKPRSDTNFQTESCSILIPARNEENTLGDCLNSAIQQGNDVIEIIVCNDHSEDQTAAVVSQYRKLDDRLRMIEANDLPGGWCGKNFACASLAAQARGNWMLFLDADTILSHDAVSIIIAEARHRRCSFLSCWPGLILESAWERALMPMLNFVVFTLFPAPLSIQRNDPSLGLAHGTCILMRRADYQVTGGHQLVFDQVFEDTCLARSWRASGRRGICLDGQDLVRVRMYDSLGAIWRGFQKNFYPAFSRAYSFWLFIGFHVVCFLLPFAILPMFAAGNLDLWPLGAAALCVLLIRLIQAWRFRYPYWSILVHPLAEIMLIAIGLSSWWKCHWGQGVEWKGRVYGRLAFDNDPVKRQTLSNTSTSEVRSNHRE